MDFFNSSQYDIGGGEGGPGGSAASNQNTENLDQQNFVHVTCSQIAKLTRKEDGLVIFRQKIHMVQVIGVVLSVEELTTKNIYLIEDYTAGSPIEAQLWKNEEEGAETSFVVPTVLERTYIRVIGQVRYDERKPFIVVFRIDPIEDPNLIPTHYLEAIHDSMFLEKRMNATLNNKADNLNQFSDTGFMNTSGMSGFTEIQKAVLNVLNKHSRDSSVGLKRYEIRNYLTGVKPSQIDDAINFLTNEGHIFSTTDEDTFKSTDF